MPRKVLYLDHRIALEREAWGELVWLAQMSSETITGLIRNFGLDLKTVNPCYRVKLTRPYFPKARRLWAEPIRYVRLYPRDKVHPAGMITLTSEASLPEKGTAYDMARYPLLETELVGFYVSLALHLAEFIEGIDTLHTRPGMLDDKTLHTVRSFLSLALASHPGDPTREGMEQREALRKFIEETDL